MIGVVHNGLCGLKQTKKSFAFLFSSQVGGTFTFRKRQRVARFAVTKYFILSPNSGSLNFARKATIELGSTILTYEPSSESHVLCSYEG